MGKLHVCRICRRKDNLKYSINELSPIKAKQLLLFQGGSFNKDDNVHSNRNGQCNNSTYEELICATPALGNICYDCDDRLQIFHNLEEEVSKKGAFLPSDNMSANEAQSFKEEQQRADTPIIVDDDEMLFNLFFEKVEGSRKLQQKLRRQQRSCNTVLPLESNILEVSNRNYNDYVMTDSTQQQTACNNNYRIVACIDLVESDEMSLNNNFSVLNNNQDILPKSITQNLYNKMHITSSANTSKRRRLKNYNEREFRVVQNINLISSDSESEEVQSKTEVGKKLTDTPIALDQINSEDIVNINSTANNLRSTSYTCTHCQVNLDDQDSLNTHLHSHLIIKCPVCFMDFTLKQHLVYHMRYKHREYNGHVLVERPRVSKDSAMTIRLRYMQRFTFYECQLCGRIDDVFKYHKEHIIEKHSNESKSLRDPIMNRLKCPICKVECSTQYLTLCRHLLSCHEASQYKDHLREVIQMNASGWSKTRQKEIFNTAYVYQFANRKTLFFQCKLCHKVVSGYLHYMGHLRSHKRTSINNTTQKLKEQKLEQSCETTINKNMVFSNTFLKTKENVNKSKIRLKNKPKFKYRKNNISKKHQQKSSLLRLIPLQTFQCKFCKKKFNGFRLLNLHLIQTHQTDEFYKYDKTFMSINSLRMHGETNGHKYETQEKDIQIYSKKQNLCKQSNNSFDETLQSVNLQKNMYAVPFNGIREKHLKDNNDAIDNCKWLQDLLRLNMRRNSKDNGSISLLFNNSTVHATAKQCPYCLHLFRNVYDLQQHTKLFHVNNRSILIKYETLT